MRYRVILSSETLDRIQAYGAELAAGTTTPGAYLSALLLDNTTKIDATELLLQLLRTKRPQIFAESAVVGDGSDWNGTELSLLGDISIAADVQIFDDGRHNNPTPHDPPFQGTLAFTCGALLRSGFGTTTPDLAEVLRDGIIDVAAYRGLYARRLLAVFAYIQATALHRDQYALVTIPGLGCGQFAGPFQGRLGPMLQEVLVQLFAENAHLLNRIQAVIFDPYSECADFSVTFGDTQFRVRPLSNSRNPRPQLCPPTSYQEEATDDFRNCDLYSLVAWDHVSWPGNDFFIGSRSTDDGVKAAATSSMYAITGIEGHYDVTRARYQPPSGYGNWEECVRRNGVKLQLGEPFIHSDPR